MIALAAYDQYMPQQETLPGGFQLMEMQEYEHAVYGTTALSGIWQLKGTVYYYSPDNLPKNPHPLELGGWMEQHDVEASIYIHVVVGPKNADFEKYLQHFSSQGGSMDIPWTCFFEAGEPLELGVGEDEALHFAARESAFPGYMFSKGGLGVLVLSSQDPWIMEKLGVDGQELDKVLLAIAQSIGQSIPATEPAAGAAAGKKASAGGQTGPPLPSATVLLATALSSLMLMGGALINAAINRPVVNTAKSVQILNGSPRLGEERNGQIWYKPPWDQGGPMWISKSEYVQIQKMTAEGKVWSDRWGWTDPSAREQNEAARSRHWASFASQDQTARSAGEAINLARHGYQQSLQNIFNNQRRYDLEAKQLNNLREAGKAAKNVAYWENVCRNTETISRTADLAINIMGKTVPGGGYISDAYTVLRGAAEGLGEAMAKGGNYGRHIVGGTIQGAYDLAFDKAKDRIFDNMKQAGKWSKVSMSANDSPVYLIKTKSL